MSEWSSYKDQQDLFESWREYVDGEAVEIILEGDLQELSLGDVAAGAVEQGKKGASTASKLVKNVGAAQTDAAVSGLKGGAKKRYDKKSPESQERLKSDYMIANANNLGALSKLGDILITLRAMAKKSGTDQPEKTFTTLVTWWLGARQGIGPQSFRPELVHDKEQTLKQFVGTPKIELSPDGDPSITNEGAQPAMYQMSDVLVLNMLNNLFANKSYKEYEEEWPELKNKLSFDEPPFSELYGEEGLLMKGFGEHGGALTASSISSVLPPELKDALAAKAPEAPAEEEEEKEEAPKLKVPPELAGPGTPSSYVSDVTQEGVRDYLRDRKKRKEAAREAETAHFKEDFIIPAQLIPVAGLNNYVANEATQNFGKGLLQDVFEMLMAVETTHPGHAAAAAEWKEGYGQQFIKTVQQQLTNNIEGRLKGVQKVWTTYLKTAFDDYVKAAEEAEKEKGEEDAEEEGEETPTDEVSHLKAKIAAIQSQISDAEKAYYAAGATDNDARDEARKRWASLDKHFQSLQSELERLERGDEAEPEALQETIRWQQLAGITKRVL